MYAYRYVYTHVYIHANVSKTTLDMPHACIIGERIVLSRCITTKSNHHSTHAYKRVF